jgi:uncharacterized protein YndB with AHSA1/START domain
MPELSTLVPAGTADILLSKLYDADRETVFAAWTDAEALAAWWAPDGCVIETRHADIRPGGLWAYRMTTPGGKSFENRHKYEVIDRPERLVYRQGDRPEDDNAVVVTVTFAVHGSATLVTLRIVFSSPAWREKLIPMGAVRYPGESLLHLAFYLAQRQREGRRAEPKSDETGSDR